MNFVLRYFTLFLLMCLFGGCGSQDKKLNIKTANERGILLVGIGPDPEGLDPQLISGVTEQNVLRALFEGLVVLDPKTLEPQPGVAQSWEVQNDGKTYLFHLRPNARWNNGEPLTSNDFVFSFKRLFSPQLASTNVGNYFAIKNAHKFYSGQCSFNQVGVKAIDATTLSIELERPIPFFLQLLAQTECYPLNEKSIQQHNGFDGRNASWTHAENLVSNGAFNLKQWLVGEKLVTEKNPYYWDQQNVKLNAVHFYPIADVATEERAFRRGQLHITENVPYSKMNDYLKNQSKNFQCHPYLGTYYYLLNIHVKPLDDIRVRRALTLAINREALTGCDQLKIKHRSAYQLVPEGCSGFKSKQILHEDLQLAQKLLAEAGFPNGQGFPKLTLLFNTTEGQTYIASAIQEMWKKNLNISVELINQEWKVYLQRRREQKFEIARGGWIGDYNDPTTFLDIWETHANNNFVKWSNVQYDAYLQKARECPDKEERLQYLEEAESILLQEMPLIPLHSSTTTHLVHPSVQGWYGNLLDCHPYKGISLNVEKD